MTLVSGFGHGHVSAVSAEREVLARPFGLSGRPLNSAARYVENARNEGRLRGAEDRGALALVGLGASGKTCRLFGQKAIGPGQLFENRKVVRTFQGELMSDASGVLPG